MPAAPALALALALAAEVHQDVRLVSMLVVGFGVMIAVLKFLQS